MEPLEAPELLTIEWEMMDKSRFISFTTINSLALRSLVYPFTVVKTRLQVQSAYNYTGTCDALRQIVRYEGFRTLYKGFMINSMSSVSSMAYIITYEKIRDCLSRRGVTDSSLKGFVGGGISSLVGQTFVTPFDVVSQHIMVLGRNSINPLGLPPTVLQSKFQTLKRIIKEVYRHDGIAGFYRGYFASLVTYVPGSAFWWTFYPMYQEAILPVLPNWTPLVVVQCLAGPLSGVTTCVITNPLDIIRARIQVQRLNSWTTAMRHVWRLEKFRIFTIGLSARMVQSSITSFLLVLGYETLKRYSVSEEYKSQIRW
ncbi:solute carrier family 25 member 44-like isoform X1 [Varroa jacobsoni]|uniref:Solute carrier family 25 member 44 n=1 Tax=Varroa destructor TaxID=109461 RepID=A0A7M7KT20_VARDE|nr:solute carrier family 25 member 44-like isoform X2 [Varroa destructor]XP_022689637.1 solute carrier family 25 member 44-like isoform X1 [Varroa jacobsoni]